MADSKESDKVTTIPVINSKVESGDEDEDNLIETMGDLTESIEIIKIIFNREFEVVLNNKVITSFFGSYEEDYKSQRYYLFAEKINEIVDKIRKNLKPDFIKWLDHEELVKVINEHLEERVHKNVEKGLAKILVEEKLFDQRTADCCIKDIVKDLLYDIING